MIHIEYGTLKGTRGQTSGEENPRKDKIGEVPAKNFAALLASGLIQSVAITYDESGKMVIHLETKKTEAKK